MENKEKITLIIIYKQIQEKYENYDVNELLENILNHFAKSYNLNFSTLYFLYDGISWLGNQLKNPISKIINNQDKKDKMMSLLLCQNTEYGIAEEDKITIVLSIESVEAVALYGKKVDIIRDIIKKNSSLIKFDLKWCIFKYKAKEIDLNQKFDNIADDSDKKKLKIHITLNYTIPLFVNLVNKKGKNTVQCLLKDRVKNIIDKYFEDKKTDITDYDLIYEKSIIKNYYYKIFYQIISEGKIQNRFLNEKINYYKSDTSNDNLEKTDTTMTLAKEKIIDNAIPVFQNNEANITKLEIEIKLILKSCCFRYKRRLSNCFNKFFNKLIFLIRCFCFSLLMIVAIAIGLGLSFLLLGGWMVFLKLSSKKNNSNNSNNSNN